MITEMIEGFVYKEALSIYEKFICAATCFYLVGLAFLEVSGKHLQYSKFSNSGIPSKIGMLIIYTPALFAGVASFWIFPGGGIRFLMLKSAVTIHFLKRDLEVLFLHKFSGFFGVESAVIIAATYFTAAAGFVYFHHQTEGLPEPSVDLKKNNNKGYDIPRGGLFNLVICPHYLFEITTFVGFSFISQTIFTYVCALGVALYLSARSYATRKWYVSKFENFPNNVKALIPYVF
ncbi:uncharacterized protein LOC125188691 isoform X2 [Salvia hispanica]|uniref:uncharacterized protein LOC125188691 isoform X2 n=1 Tax=Salvia hispanica TaxID=49212 RepID=UPI0020090C2F|nr:uncharacterized protein LOC125188691 isoform X2 [Salvia hispanica]